MNNSKPKHIVSCACTLVLGVVLVLSACLKAWSGNDFADTLLLYGADWLPALVPLLIAVEMLLGLAMLLRIHTKRMAVGVGAFLVGVSMVYLYGVVARGITDCGCFGPLHLLPEGPLATFSRNAVLLALTGLTWWASDNEVGVARWKSAVIIVLTALATFVCGLSMSKTYQLPDLSLGRKAPQEHTLEELGLSNLLPNSNDSTYALYLFSYTCPHCRNSFANFEQYQTMHIVDAVYGIVVADTTGREAFMRLYQPVVPILEIPKEQMANITNSLPLLLIVEDGKIVNTAGGAISSPGIFR